jgi:hypothetical protein
LENSCPFTSLLKEFSLLAGCVIKFYTLRQGLYPDVKVTNLSGVGKRITLTTSPELFSLAQSAEPVVSRTGYQ